MFSFSNYISKYSIINNNPLKTRTDLEKVPPWYTFPVRNIIEGEYIWTKLG
jgi:hypothetical protein